MERCDFSSVLRAIRSYISDDKGLSQIDLLYELFASFMDDKDSQDFDLDNGLVCRWFNGQAKVSPRITSYYMIPKNRENLAADVEKRILPLLYDSSMAVQVVCELLVQDTTISDRKKRQISRNYPCRSDRDEAVFLASALCFGMERSFVKRDRNFQLLAAAGTLSPTTSEYIFGGDVPKPCPHFCGREEELSMLHGLLTKHGKVFLSGIAGIGKSELAKAYAKVYKADYINVLYLVYSGNLQKDITNMDFADDLPADNEEERFRKHNRFLRTLKEDTLLIIDNFNTDVAQEAFLAVALKYRCRILFTTRSKMLNSICLNLEEIADSEVLFHLAASFYSEAEKNRVVVEQLIQTVHRHTLAVELAARLLETGLLEPQQVLEKLREEKAKFDAADAILLTKDGQSCRATYYDHIHRLFALFQLGLPQQQVMRCLSLIPISGISARLFGRWMNLHDLNAVNELVERGFVQSQAGNRIMLHPMIQEVAVADFVPSVRSCHAMLESIRMICQLHGQNVPYYKLLFQTVENGIDLLTKDDGEYYLRLLEDVFSYMQTYQYEHGMRRIAEELHLLLEDPAIGNANDRALLLDCFAALEKDSQKAIGFLKDALKLLPEICTDNALLLSNLNANLGGLYNLTGQMQLAKQHMKTAFSILKEYGLLHCHDSIMQSVNYAMLLLNMGDAMNGLLVLRCVSHTLKKAAGEGSSDYALVQKSIGTLLLASGQVKQAIKCYQTALKAYAAAFCDDPQIVFELRQEILRECRTVGLPEKALAALMV